MPLERPNVFSEQPEKDQEYLDEVERGEELVEFIQKQLPEWRRIAVMAGITLHEEYIPNTTDKILEFQNFFMGGCFIEPPSYSREQLKYRTALMASFGEAEKYIKTWQNSMLYSEGPFSQA